MNLLLNMEHHGTHCYLTEILFFRRKRTVYLGRTFLGGLPMRKTICPSLHKRSHLPFPKQFKQQNLFLFKNKGLRKNILFVSGYLLYCTFCQHNIDQRNEDVRKDHFLSKACVINKVEKQNFNKLTQENIIWDKN